MEKDVQFAAKVLTGLKVLIEQRIGQLVELGANPSDWDCSLPAKQAAYQILDSMEEEFQAKIDASEEFNRRFSVRNPQCDMS